MKKEQLKRNWIKYDDTPFNLEQADCYWQKRIKTIEDTDVYAEIVQWTVPNGFPTSWELRIQIHQDVSITGMTININNFNYGELNFCVIEKHAKKIINNLTIT